MVKLLESSRHDAIMTVVDSVSKRVHFVPIHTTVMVEGAARLFLHHVWKLHGLPKCIVSNRGKRVQKGIAYWNKQNHAMPAPNCMLKVREEIIEDEGL